MQKLKASQSQTHEKILQVYHYFGTITIIITITITSTITTAITIAITSAELAQTTHVCQIHEAALIVWQQCCEIACKPVATQRHGT